MTLMVLPEPFLSFYKSKVIIFCTSNAKNFFLSDDSQEFQQNNPNLNQIKTINVISQQVELQAQIILCGLVCIKQIYFSSMQFITNGSDLLPFSLNQNFALRRNVRIKSSKLPADFFMAPRSQRYVPSPILSRQIGTDLSNREPRTPSFQCRTRETRLTNETIEHERKVETARPSLQKINNEDELISVVLSSTNKLRRVVRKQSLDMKQNYNISMDDRYLRLPKILNKAAQRH